MFLMPSRFESYGWVYLEALANGAIPLACDRPVQREILDNGNFGLLCKDDPLSISNRLVGVLSNPIGYAGQALRGRRHWLEHYSPGVVAGLFYDALLHSVEPCAANFIPTT